jgi:hypothetical protein
MHTFVLNPNLFMHCNCLQALLRWQAKVVA